MNWEREILSLVDPTIKRIRNAEHHFSASFTDKEVPFTAPIPKDTGFCRRPLLRDCLVVVGHDERGQEKKVHCGLFSDKLLGKVQAAIADGKGTGAQLGESKR